MEAQCDSSKRERNFNRDDELIVMTEAGKRHHELFSAFSGAGGSRKRKQQAWEEVTAALNSQSTSGCVRTVQQVKKKHENIKTEAKRKAYLEKHPPTGGGPPPPKPTDAEKLFLDLMGDAPSVVGLDDGIESGVQQIIFPVIQMEESLDVPQFSLPEPPESSLCSQPLVEKVRRTRYTNDKSSSDLLYHEVLQLEKQRIEAELRLAQVRLDHANQEHALRMRLLEKQIETL